MDISELCAVVEHALLRSDPSGRRSVAGPLGEALLIDAAAAEATGPLAALQGVAGLRRALARTFAAMGCAALSAPALQRLCERLSRIEGSGCAARMNELGRLYQGYRGRLGPHRLDDAQAFAVGVRALTSLDAASILPQLTAGAPDGAVVLRGLHRAPPWDGMPTPHALMQAIAALCNLQNTVEIGAGAPPPLRVLLPMPSSPGDGERPALDQALRPILDALYQRHELNLEVGWEPLGPQLGDALAQTVWGRFLRGLFLPSSAPPRLKPAELSTAPPSKGSREPLSLSPLPSPASEARHVACAVFDLIQSGVQPSDIGIVVESPQRRGRLIAELHRYGVPVFLPPPSRLESALFGSLGASPLPPPLALILGLYELLARRSGQSLPREALIHLLTTRYLRWPLSTNEAAAPKPWQLAQALRGAGIRELALTTGDSADAEELRRRIDEWLQQKQPASRTENATATDKPALYGALERIIGELTSLPEQATLFQHVAALRRLCDRLQLSRGATDFTAAWLGRSPLDLDETPSLTTAELLAAECRALARDQAALAVLEQALDELPRRAQKLGLHNERLARGRFAGLLRAALTRQATPILSGSAGLGVEVASLSQLRRRPFAQLFVIGLLDGELPAPASEDPLLDDDDRRLCNRLLDAPLFPLAQHAVERAALDFAEVLAHTQAAHLSWPIADEEGRPLLRSPFVDTVLHAAAQSEPPPLRQPLLPEPSEARHASELWTVSGRAAAPTPLTLGPALLTALTSRDRARARRLTSRIAIESTRATWFANLAAQRGDVSPGPLCGQLSDAALIAALAPRLPGSRDRPLSASALEDYARCPFRFFVYRVLKAAPLSEGGEDLDPLANGRLHHQVLEKFFVDRREKGRLPLRGDADDRAALERAIETSLAEFSVTERIGHPALFRTRLRRLRADLLQLILREAATPIEPGLAPGLFEHKFGPLAITAKEGGGDDTALHIAGVIDRVDLGPQRALVLDYKTGRLQRYQAYQRDELLQTAFQLPLYAAAVKNDPAVVAVTGAAPSVAARFYAVRQAQVSEAIDNQALIALDEATRQQAGEHNVAEAAYRLWRRLRGGDFRVAPRTCDGCGLESVCRIAIDPAPAESPIEEESASSSSSSANSSANSSATPTSGRSDVDVRSER